MRGGDSKLLRVTKNTKESNDRIIQRFSNRVKASRLVQEVKEKRYYTKKPTRLKRKASALMREHYRSLREKRKLYL